MEIRIPHQVIYKITKSAPIEDVVSSLLASEQLLRESALLLEKLFPNLHVETVEISVEEISDGSLKEILIAAIVVSLQKDMEHDVPLVIEHLTGTHFPAEYNSIITLIVAALIFYGIDFVHTQMSKAALAAKVRGQFNETIKEISAESGVSEEKIGRILEERFAKGRLRILSSTAIKFFAPSKRSENAPILLGAKTISKETVQDVPSDAQIEEADVPEIVQQHQNVKIDLHAHDADRATVGWAASVANIAPNRIKLELAPHIKPAELFTKRTVKGDIAVMLRKQSDGSYKPSVLHLMNLRK